MTTSRHGEDHFADLNLLLRRHVQFWQIRPFHSRQLCWHQSQPDLCAALLNLDDATLAHLESSPQALNQWLEPWLGRDGKGLLALTQLPRLPQRCLPIPARFDSGIPGRKWQQIQAFAATLPGEPRPLLEWCAGKGHLGRLLAVVDGRQVVSLERDATLCTAGAAQAQRLGATMRFVQADALAPDSGNWLPIGGQAVALHACGDLHTRLMAHWATGACQRLTFSPCCYHLIAGDSYLPLSAQAQASGLKLGKQDLQLAVQETVTAGLTVQRQRQRELLWRLAFDEWQREARGIDDYLPLSACAKSLLTGTFGDFCTWAARVKALPAPKTLQEDHWLALGKARVRMVRLMELVSHVFRRPLEVWLALDRVRYLAEQGAEVNWGTFCAKAITPRNIVIDAQRP